MNDVTESVCGKTMCLSQLSPSGVQGSEKNLFGQFISKLSLSEIMVVQGEPDGVSQLSYYRWERENENHGGGGSSPSYLMLLTAAQNFQICLTSYELSQLCLHNKWKSWTLHNKYILINAMSFFFQSSEAKKQKKKAKPIKVKAKKRKQRQLKSLLGGDRKPLPGNLNFSSSQQQLSNVHWFSCTVNKYKCHPLKAFHGQTAQCNKIQQLKGLKSASKSISLEQCFFCSWLTAKKKNQHNLRDRVALIIAI